MYNIFCGISTLSNLALNQTFLFVFADELTIIVDVSTILERVLEKISNDFVAF